MSAIDAQRVAFEQSRATALDSAACLIAAFRVLGVPESMFDIGCGAGHLVLIARAFGVGASGFDIGLPEESKVWGLLNHDLRRPIPIVCGAKLALCLEVAEHLPSGSADTLCDTLAEATGGALLFSAATPGQGGSGHLNEQPHEYWRAKLEARGLRFDAETTKTLRLTWIKVVASAWWYPKNLMVFRRPA